MNHRRLAHARDYGPSPDVRKRLAVHRTSPDSEHRIRVGRSLRDRLDHVPVLHDLAALQTKDVGDRFSARIVAEAVPMTVEYDIVVLCEGAFDFAVRIRVV